MSVSELKLLARDFFCDLKNLPIIIASLLGMLGLAFLVTGFFSKKDLFSAAGAAFAAAGLMYTAYCYRLDSDKKRSEFYLMQIKEYFANAVNLIGNGANNSIQWHNAVISLKTAIDVAKNLTDNSHKNIFIHDYIDTVFKIGKIIDLAPSFKFFYGLEYTEYPEDGDTKSLFQESHSSPNKSFRGIVNDNIQRSISPWTLSFLCRFLEKGNAWFLQKSISGVRTDDRDKFFHDFSQSISDKVISLEEGLKYGTQVSGKLVKYINDFNGHLKKDAEIPTESVDAYSLLMD